MDIQREAIQGSRDKAERLRKTLIDILQGIDDLD